MDLQPEAAYISQMGIDLFENVIRNDRVTKKFLQTNIHTMIEAVENFFKSVLIISRHS